MIYMASSLFVLISMFVLFPIKDKVTARSFLACLYFILLVFIIFRNGDKVADYNNYKYIFLNFEKNKFNNDVEFSMSLIIRLLKAINLGYIFLFAIYGFIGLSLKYSLIKKDNYSYLALLGYLSYEMLNQEITAMRAGVSIAFVLIAIYQLGKANNKNFIFFVILGTFFHYSALSCLLLYPLSKVKKRNILLILFLFSFILPLLGNKVIYIILNKIGITYLQSKLYQYGSGMNSWSTTFRLSSILRYLLFTIFIWKYELLIKKNNFYLVEMQTLLLGIYMNALFSFSPTFQYRISSIFYSIEIFMYKNFIYIFKSKTVGKLVAISLCLFDFIYLILSVKILGEI